MLRGKSDSQETTVPARGSAGRHRYVRECMFCGGRAVVHLPPDATDLDVEAEFASEGRAFSDREDGDTIGVGCVRCSTRRWSEAQRADGA